MQELQISKSLLVVAIRTEHGREFGHDNNISNNFPAPRTSQRNGVVEMNSRTMEDMDKTLIYENDLRKSL